MPRAQDATCAICMDSLFNARDDLDEVLPITAPDCGHVFHESCLQSWFTTQAAAYLARMREHGVRLRDESLSIDDAPAECPSCRAECYADPETGQPILHRLFINFGDAAAGSSQPPSSPPGSQRWYGGGRHSGLDATGLGIARRAKGLGNEISALHPDSSEEDVNAAMRRAEKLEADANALSAKTSMGLKKYIGGLTVALNALRAELQTHPLIPSLRDQISLLEDANNRQIAAMTHMERVAIPAAVKKAVEAEKARGEKAIKAVEAQRDLIQRSLEKEQVGRKNFRRAMMEREAEMERRVEAAEKAAEKEAAEREALAAQLAERTKLVKVWQTKAENRKKWQLEAEQLRAENERLKAAVAAAASANASAANANSIEPEADVEADMGWLDEAPMDPMDIPDFSDWSKDKHDTADPDLEITFDDEPQQKRATASLDVYMPPLSHDLDLDDEAPARRSVTARTFTFDVDEGRVRRKDKGKGKASKADGSHRRETEPKGKENTRSRYFPTTRDDILVAATSPARGESPSPTPSPSKRARRDPDSPLAKSRSRSVTSGGNPFKTTKSTAPAQLPPPAQLPRSTPEIIDLVSSSPPARPLARSSSSNAVFPRGMPRKTKSMLEVLGVADDKGRIKKGVAVGSKMRRRA